MPPSSTSSIRSVLAASWMPPILAAVLALLVTVPALFGPSDHLYPVRADSQKYHDMGRGVALFIEELPSVLGKMTRGSFTDEDRARYQMDGPMLQHATSYLLLLGATYVVFHGDEASGRVLTLLLFLGSAALLSFWTRRHFGILASFLVIPLFVFWPAHVYYGTAIMTEIPMIFFMIGTAVALDLTRDRGWAWGGGLLLGFLALAKITFRLVVAPILALDLWAAWKTGRSRGFRTLGGRLAGVLAVLALWGGFLHLGGLSGNPVAESGEQELWVFRGNYVPDRGFETVGLGDVAQPELLEAIKRNRDVAEDEKQKSVFRDAFRLTVAKNPSRWVALVLAKVRWFWIYPAVKEDVIAWWGALPPPAHLQSWIVVLALAGLAGALRRGVASWIPAALALYLCVVHAATHLVSRYDIPAVGLAMPYAAFALSGLSRWRPLRRGAPHRPRSLWRPLLLLLPAGFLVALAVLTGRDVFVAGGLSVRSASALESAVLALAIVSGALPGWALLRHLGWSRLVTALGLSLVLVVPALTLLAERHVDFDPDVWKSRLSAGGDRIVQRITLPENMDRRAFSSAEIVIDLLPTLEAVGDFVVWVDGREVHRFRGRLESRGEDFEVDERIHAVQDRYRRVRETVEAHLAGFVKSRYPEVGLEYYRQWYRIPVSLDLLEEGAEVTIELEWQGEGAVDVYGDHGVAVQPQRRIVFAPAFVSNPYELSTYQFQLFASDRERADARLIRPLRLLSSGTRAEFRQAGKSLGSDLSPARGQQGGEFRIRLRTRLRGGYVSRPDPSKPGKVKPVWAVWPTADDKPADSDTVRLLASKRETFVDGWQTY